MKRSAFILSAALAIASLAVAQSGPSRFSATTGDVSLSAAGTTLTIQQPSVASGAAKQVTLETATVYCSVACNVTQAYNGTAATATSGALTPIPGTPANATAAATVWTASNVGSGTAVGGIIHVQAGQTVTICLSTTCGALASVTMGNTGTATNYSFIVSTITGTANITLIESEK